MTTWYIVKLELARTEQFPDGSPTRGYVIRLPLGPDHLIDDAACQVDPERASIRRFWSGEPDQSGYLLKVPKGWAFSYELGEDDDENLFHLENHAIKKGEYLTLTEPDGDIVPFRVVSVLEE